MNIVYTMYIHVMYMYVNVYDMYVHVCMNPAYTEGPIPVL